MADKNIPEIRFDGFNEEWEVNTLNEISKVYDGTHQTPNYTEKGVMFLSVENIKDLKSNKFISEEDFYNEFNISPKKGDVLMTRIGDVGTVNVVETNQPRAYYVSLALIKTEILNSYFLKGCISSETVQKDIWLRTLHIAFPKKINKGEIEKIRIQYPKKKIEQTKIGSFFENIDQLLNQHQTQHKKLKALKKAMLSKLFPKQGETVPEIRFKGFSGEWEVKELGELMDVTSVKRIHQSDWEKSGIPFFRARDIVALFKQKEINDKIFISKNKYEEYSRLSGKVEIGHMLVTGVGTIGVPYLINNDNPLYFKDGNIIWFKNKKVNSLFLFYSFNQNNIKDFIKNSAGIGTVGTYTIESGKKTPLIFPSEKEQQKIGNYFKNLDSLIENHHKQIEKLSVLKKACLSKMFV